MQVRTALALATTVVLIVASRGLDAGEIPRTASGEPDLSGNYDIASLTPYQRDPKFGDQLYMTVEEAEQIVRAERAVAASTSSNSDPNREAPPDGGDGSAGAAGAVGGYNYFWIDRGTEIFTVDGKFRTSIIVDPPNGRLPPLTADGEQRRAAARPYIFENTGTAWWLDHPGPGPYDDPERLPLSERCLYVGVATVPIRPVLYNNVKTIVQTDTHVMILIEWMHEARIIRLDDEHAPYDLRSLSGDSIGRWEGDTLVVETTNFLASPNEPSDLRVVERFSRIDADTINYRFTVHDPDYEAPYTGEYPWPQTQDRLYEYACHEGNYAMGNILRGARLLEKEALGRDL